MEQTAVRGTESALGSGERRRTKSNRPAIAIALIVLATLLAWLVFRDGGHASTGASGDRVAAGGPAAASVADLRRLARTVGHPIYWAGAKPGYTYELTRTEKGNIFIRYLPRGTRIGDERADFLVVGTYPLRGAYAGVQREARSEGAVTRRLAGGGLAVANEGLRKSVYFAYPHSGLQVEVYDASPKAARDLVFDGRVSSVH
jgi:hypothetical protein